jgi:diguanylate cyclase (GGDEF)-like protein/PAS domain S-box-containing protein
MTPSERPTSSMKGLLADQPTVFGFFMVIVSAAIIGWNLYDDYQATYRNSTDLLSNLARVADEQISGSLRSVDYVMQDVAAEIPRKAGETREAKVAYAKARAQSFLEIRQIFMTDAEGIIQFTTFPTINKFDASKRPYFVNPKNAVDQDRLFITGPVKVRSGEVLFFGTRPLSAADGSFAGVVGASLSLEFFDEVLRSVIPEGKSADRLATINGDLLSRIPNPENYRALSIKKSRGFRAHLISDQQTTVHRTEADTGRKQHVTVFRTLSAFPLVVSISRDYDEIMAAWRSGALLHGLVFLIVVGVTIALVRVWRFSERRAHREAQRLDDSRAFFDDVLETANAMVVGLDPEGCPVIYNSAAEEVTEYSLEELRGRNWFETMVPRKRFPAHWEAVEGAAANNVPLDISEYPVLTKSGEERFISWRNAVLTNPDGETVTISFGIDITEQKEYQARLVTANARLRSLVRALESRNQEISKLGEMVELLQACQSFEELYGIISRYAGDLFADYHGSIFFLAPSKDMLEQVVQWPGKVSPGSAIVPDECWAVRKSRPHTSGGGEGVVCDHLALESGEQSLCVPMMAQGDLIGTVVLQRRPNDVGPLPEDVVRLVVAISEQIGLALSNLRLRETLEAQALRDPLTQLYNRRYMAENFQRELTIAGRKNIPVSVVMLDVDKFKPFNDEFGHEAGDLVLKAVANMLRSLCRATDIVCRYGGEEFLIILPDATLERGLERAEFLRKEVKNMAVEFEGSTLDPISLSFGVSVFPGNGSDPDDIIRAADVALYASKNAGRDRVTAAEQNT